MTQQPTQPKTPDAYRDLGLVSNASSTEIKAAYRKLALLHHPDKNLTASGETKDATEFRRANEAYELLKDDHSKSRYDHEYTRVRADWTKYRDDVSEFTQDPEAWRRKQASAARASTAAAQRSQAQHYYDDSEDSDWENGESGWNFFAQAFGFRGTHTHQPRYAYEAQRAQEEREFEEWFEQNKRAQHEYKDNLLKRLAEERAQREEQSQRERAVKDANKQAIKRQLEETEAQQPPTNDSHIQSPEEKLALAKIWVQGVQHKYDQELDSRGVKGIYRKEAMDLGWEKKKGRQTCHFCDAYVHEYSYRIPSGGAIACRACKSAITASTLKHPFTYVNTYSGTSNAKAKKKAKQAKATATPESESRGPVEAEEGTKVGKEAEKLSRDLTAREEMAQRHEKARIKREAREAREKAAREAHQEAEKKAARDKAVAVAAMREKAESDQAARKAAEERKAARARELQEEKARKKAIRKKAAKARAALEKKKERAAKEEKERPQREAREMEAREREAQDAHQRTVRETEEASQKETLERKVQQPQENAARPAREATESRAEDTKKRVGETLGRVGPAVAMPTPSVDKTAATLAPRVSTNTYHDCIRIKMSSRSGKSSNNVRNNVAAGSSTPIETVPKPGNSDRRPKKKVPKAPIS